MARAVAMLLVEPVLIMSMTGMNGKPISTPIFKVIRTIPVELRQVEESNQLRGRPFNFEWLINQPFNL